MGQAIATPSVAALLLLELHVLPGEHEIVLSHPDYRTSHSRVALEAGQRRSLEVPLDEAPRFYERWWFWTAVGLAAAGGAVTYVALTTEKQGSTGDIPPGNVTAPLLRF